MDKEINFQTYLSISPDKFSIYLFEKTSLKNLYKEEVLLDNKNNIINFNALFKFLEDNIYKIEKLVGNFINNIFVVLNTHKISKISFGIKRKSYDEVINKKFLEKILTDAKDLFNENYENHKIIHIIINKYIYTDKIYYSFKENLVGDNLCIEVEFKSILKKFISEIDKTLGKFQIKVVKYIDGDYIKHFFKNDNLEYYEMLTKIQSGFNQNEVELVTKNLKKSGFFEKFFQLFS